MALTLKEESVLDQWSTIVDNASGRAHGVIEDIQARMEASQIPGNCSWELEEVKSSGWFSKVQREFLLIRLGDFNDYRMYVAARDYGIHLDVCRFLTVEPGFFKKAIAEKLSGGFGDALSAPKNILVEQDLKAWVTVVHHCVLDSVSALMQELGQDPSKIRRQSKGMLEVW